MTKALWRILFSSDARSGAQQLLYYTRPLIWVTIRLIFVIIGV